MIRLCREMVHHLPSDSSSIYRHVVQLLQQGRKVEVIEGTMQPLPSAAASSARHRPWSTQLEASCGLPGKAVSRRRCQRLSGVLAKETANWRACVKKNGGTHVESLRNRPPKGPSCLAAPAPCHHRRAEGEIWQARSVAGGTGWRQPWCDVTSMPLALEMAHRVALRWAPDYCLRQGHQNHLKLQ